MKSKKISRFVNVEMERAAGDSVDGLPSIHFHKKWIDDSELTILVSDRSLEDAVSVVSWLLEIQSEIKPSNGVSKRERPGGIG
ncbi:MAG: hypothetical protein ABIJ21_06355 [Nanoarchaeota archaeon]